MARTIYLKFTTELEEPEYLKQALDLLGEYGKVETLTGPPTAAPVVAAPPGRTHDSYGNPYDPSAANNVERDAYGNPYRR